MLPVYLLSHLFLCLHTGERVLASGSVQLPRFTLLESGSLLISPSHISDAGTYTCMASNSRGIDEASADLVVWGECAGLDGFHILLKKYTCLRYVVNAQANPSQTLGNGVAPHNGKAALNSLSYKSTLVCKFGVIIEVFSARSHQETKYNLAACHFN